jgi:periplasmic divalent cation tolerance protein
MLGPCQPPPAMESVASSPMQPAAPPLSEVVLAITTEASLEKAEGLAQVLLQRQLVACVSLRPLRSLYAWQGGIEDTAEVELLLKTSPCRLAALEACVHDLHSYDTPEWISWRAGASPAYASWLWAATSSRSEP